LVITDIRAGEIISIDPILEEFKFAPVLDETKRAGLAIVGYYFMFELLNGFRKEFYYSKDKILAHARRYSKSFGEGPWQTNQDEMCRKTMIRLCLPKWGPLSIEMQEALKADQAVLKFDEATESEAIPEYIDSTTTKDLTTDEYTITEAEAEPDKAEEEFKQRKSKAAPDLAEVGK
jgi:recombination protein RecT